MTSQNHQIVTYYLNLIEAQIKNGTDFTEWLLDADPKFSPQYSSNESKVNYFKQNLSTIIQFFIIKNKIKDKMQYPDFAFEFLEFIEETRFPLIAQTAQKPQHLPSQNISQKQLHQPFEKIQTVQKQLPPIQNRDIEENKKPPFSSSHTKAVHYGKGMQIGKNIGLDFDGNSNKQEQKKKRMINKLSECFDQPQKRHRLLNEFRNDLSQM